MSSKNWDKSANKYYDDVISPIKNSINSPLKEDLKKLKGKVVDLGCGLGELTPLLSKKFSEVYEWDYSAKMIKNAKEKNEGIKNAFFEVKDLLDIKEKNVFDVGVAINSLLDPDMLHINKMIKNIYGLLKKGGTLLCVLPSIESYIYQEMLTNERKKLGKSVPKEDYFEANKIDFINGGIILDNGKQKAFYRFEILYRFEKAGFTNIEISKVRYHWKDWFEAGQRYFPGEKEPWDWYVKCRKK